jgi:2,3-bisphosphoglycerate-dependent phosphoglycerate mutase
MERCMQHVDDRRTLFVFRHGETDWNRAGRLQGHIDTPLNATGLAQAEALAESLRAHRLDAVVSSDLSRALNTAQIVALHLGVPLTIDHGLRETSVGDAEGLLWEEAKARFGAELTERWYSDGNTAFPGGETGRATLTRGLAALRRFAGEHPIGGSGCRPTVPWYASSSSMRCRPAHPRSERATRCCSSSNTSRPPTGSR